MDLCSRCLCKACKATAVLCARQPAEPTCSISAVFVIVECADDAHNAATSTDKVTTPPLRGLIDSKSSFPQVPIDAGVAGLLDLAEILRGIPQLHRELSARSVAIPIAMIAVTSQAIGQQLVQGLLRPLCIPGQAIPPSSKPQQHRQDAADGPCDVGPRNGPRGAGGLRAQHPVGRRRQLGLGPGAALEKGLRLLGARCGARAWGRGRARARGQHQRLDLDPGLLAGGVGVVHGRVGRPTAAGPHARRELRAATRQLRDLPHKVARVLQGYPPLPKLPPGAATLGVHRERVPHAVKDVLSHEDPLLRGPARHDHGITQSGLRPTDSEIQRGQPSQLRVCGMER
mmetsp:Transcript_48210/g.153891  ORF Transcript_48210/g.153891 Transcript_48210/m.153891 type:complete len:343 (-) Transcript_48210:823-1851(-)